MNDLDQSFAEIAVVPFHSFFIANNFLDSKN